MNMAGINSEESEVIHQILNGKKDMYRTLVNRYSPMVFSIVRRFEKDDDEAEELAQQIFVKAYEKLDSFDMKSKFSTWLYSLAANHCRDYVKNIRRANKRFSEMEPDYLDQTMIDEETPYLNLEVSEWKHRLMNAMNTLKEEYSEPFLMKYRDGMSYEAISERMDVSVSALKVRVHRARKELKEQLDKQG